jgi:hypothetical protein
MESAAEIGESTVVSRPGRSMTRNDPSNRRVAQSPHDVKRTAVERVVFSIAVSSVLAVAAIVATAALIGWHATDCLTTLPDGHFTCRAFISTPQFLVWVMLLCGQAAFWALAIVPLYRTLRSLVCELRAEESLTTKTIAGITLSALAFATAAVLFAFAPRILPSRLASRTHYPGHWPLPSHTPKLTILTAIAIVIALAAIVGMWMAGIALQWLASKGTADLETLNRFLVLRTTLNGLLTLTGVIVGLGTLSSGALRNAVLALNPPAPAKPLFEFDAQYVLVYGLFFTGLLAIAYAPSYLALRTTGTWLRNNAYPLPDPGTPTFSAVLKERETFDDFLQVNLSASASFKASVAILAPLASSLIALLIPKLTGS